MKGASIVIRTKNEGKDLEPVLKKVFEQAGDFAIEVIIVDSGSTDNTLDIAMRYGCRIINIPPEQFTWGLALNRGMEAASHECCVLLSGHCLPVDNHWLDEITRPLKVPSVAATYGGQVPIRGVDPFEEVELDRWFPPEVRKSSAKMFTSANSCLKRSLWQVFRFNELLNSLEDGDLSNRLKKEGFAIRYVPAAGVFHSHPLSLTSVYRRWYWRARTGMHLRRYSDLRVKLASKSIFPPFAAFISTCFYFVRYFSRSFYFCLKRGYISYLWKLPFYELIRQYATFTGLNDGLMDVKHNELPKEFSYFKNKIPRFVQALRFIER